MLLRGLDDLRRVRQVIARRRLPGRGRGGGLGQIAGVTEKIGYLKELGVDAIWLSPFYPSPLADGGYDVDDYRDVDPLFGTLADFDGLGYRYDEARSTKDRPVFVRAKKPQN